MGAASRGVRGGACACGVVALLASSALGGVAAAKSAKPVDLTVAGTIGGKAKGGKVACTTYQLAPDAPESFAVSYDNLKIRGKKYNFNVGIEPYAAVTADLADPSSGATVDFGRTKTDDEQWSTFAPAGPIGSGTLTINVDKKTGAFDAELGPKEGPTTPEGPVHVSGTFACKKVSPAQP